MIRMIREVGSLLLLIAFCFGSCPVYADQARLLIIGIDAIPYEVARKLTDPSLGEEAILGRLKGPAAVVSSFPSTSHLAWTGLLHPFDVPKAEGYEARYFDSNTRKAKGGLGLGSLSTPWKEFFDWRIQGLPQKALAYGLPRRYGLVELERGLKAFVRSEEPVFAFYIVSTDALGHADGPDALGEFLKDIDEALTELKQDYDIPFHTVLISDHGMTGDAPLRNIWPLVRKQLRQHGFNISKRLSREQDAVIIVYGLVSSFVVYTNADREAQAASIIASVEGVDLCAIRVADGVRVISSRGDALIAKKRANGDLLWSYQTLSGDPLGYAPMVTSLQQRTDGSDAWFTDDLWFEASKHSKYPDALYRLAQSFELVQSPSSVACSVSEGYMFGSRKAQIMALPAIGKLHWTHGALHDSASLGFLMSDLPQWQPPDVVRFDQALIPFARIGQRMRLQASSGLAR